MNKEDFLKKLKKKLAILEESEVEDILEEYAGFIDEKISQGATEEEAVKSLGDLNELAKELLSAYKIKNTNEKSGDAINNFIDQFLNTLENIFHIFANKSFKEIMRFLIEVVVILIFICICKIPFELIKSFGKDILFDLLNTLGGYSLYRIVSAIGSFILEVAYLLFAIILFVKIFESRYLHSEFQETKKDHVDLFKKKEEKVSSDSKEKKEISRKTDYEKKEHSDFGIISLFTNISILCIKCIAFFILIAVIFYIVGMTMAFGISIYLLINGVWYIGFYLIILSLLVLGICVFIVLFNFIFNRKGNSLALLLTTLSCLIFLGVGLASATIEVAHTSIIYENTEKENLKTETFEYPMKENLVLENYRAKYEIDESLKDSIKVEYQYNDYFAGFSFYEDTRTVKNFEILHLYYDVNQFTYNKTIFDDFIKDLKNKTIRARDYDMKITIYVNSEVYEKLQNNFKKYDKLYDRYDYDLEDICVILQDAGYKLPEYCSTYVEDDV